ncbi:DUF1580 domain-containing protein [Rhodopirellula europaea]|uniref:DUF1580 domain-containing protein n=1 Tax=Rhodopirellula europaea TaxID=1263866 RepID=UPI0009DAF4C9|nr:DUF1580 domain-containing protein [Rhodopirellula europaea]
MNQENKNRGAKANYANLMRLAEDLIQFKNVPPLLQKRVHASTAWRWANRGVKGVKLETVSVGGKRSKSVQAVMRFLGRTSKRQTRCAEYFRIQLRPRTNLTQSHDRSFCSIHNSARARRIAGSHWSSWARWNRFKNRQTR